MRPSFGCRYSRQPLTDRGEKGPHRRCSLVRPLPHPARPLGAGGIVLTHPDLAVEKISLADILARPPRCRINWLRNHLTDAHTPQASRREVCSPLYFDVIRRCPQPLFSKQAGSVNPNVAKVGGFQSQGIKGEAVISYRNPLIPPTAGQDLKPSGFPAV